MTIQSSRSLRPSALIAFLVASRLLALASQAGERKPLHELRVWMAEHLTADLSVPALAGERR